MNERIRELAEQAGTWEYFNAEDEKTKAMDEQALQNFAKLIVRECVEQIYPQWIKDHGHIEPTNLADAVMRVKEHFGVE